MKNKILYSLCLIVLICVQISTLKAQEQTSKGKVITCIFANTHTTIYNQYRGIGFGVTRGYLGYNYHLTPNVDAQIVADMAGLQDSDGKLRPYLRNAFIRWKKNDLSIRIGLMDLNYYELIEDFWRHQYVSMTLQDINDINYSADAGISAEYDLSKYLSIDMSIINGKGFHDLRVDKSLKYSVGITGEFLPHIKVRFMGDVQNYSKIVGGSINQSYYNNHYNQYDLDFFAGYQSKKLSVGVEYNRQFHSHFVKQLGIWGTSFFTTAYLSRHYNIYARYDYIQSFSTTNSLATWYPKDGHLIILGCEFTPIDKIHISPNIRFYKCRESSDPTLAAYINMVVSI